MTTEDFIIELFCQVDNQMNDVPNPPQAQLYPSERVTIGVLFALKGVGPSGVLSLAEAGLSAVVSPVARAHPMVPTVEN